MMFPNLVDQLPAAEAMGFPTVVCIQMMKKFLYCVAAVGRLSANGGGHGLCPQVVLSFIF